MLVLEHDSKCNICERIASSVKGRTYGKLFMCHALRLLINVILKPLYPLNPSLVIFN